MLWHNTGVFNGARLFSVLAVVLHHSVVKPSNKTYFHDGFECAPEDPLLADRKMDKQLSNCPKHTEYSSTYQDQNQYDMVAVKFEYAKNIKQQTTERPHKNETITGNNNNKKWTSHTLHIWWTDTPENAFCWRHIIRHTSISSNSWSHKE